MVASAVSSAGGCDFACGFLELSNRKCRIRPFFWVDNFRLQPWLILGETAVTGGCTGWRAQRQGSGRSFLVAFCQPFSITAQFMGQFHSSDFRRCECKGNLQNSASPGSFRKRSKQWPVPGRETEKLAYVRAGNFGRFLRLWALIDVSESGVVRLNGPKTSPERTHSHAANFTFKRPLFFQPKFKPKCTRFG